MVFCRILFSSFLHETFQLSFALQFFILQQQLPLLSNTLLQEERLLAVFHCTFLFCLLTTTHPHYLKYSLQELQEDTNMLSRKLKGHT